ncbi:MAG: hypothetical protein NUV98_00455 [Candidatus Roizmanbacteria bacterium]|nr:hypothetical protein [Candidatus Roizmanbacteria bacterium]
MTIDAREYMDTLFGPGALRVGLLDNRAGYIGAYHITDTYEPLNPVLNNQGELEYTVTDRDALGHFENGERILPGYRMLAMMGLAMGIGNDEVLPIGQMSNVEFQRIAVPGDTLVAVRNEQHVGLLRENHVIARARAFPSKDGASALRFGEMFEMAAQTIGANVAFHFAEGAQLYPLLSSCRLIRVHPIGNGDQLTVYVSSLHTEGNGTGPQYCASAEVYNHKGFKVGEVMDLRLLFTSHRVQKVLVRKGRN